jgi:hypothetical protein
MTGLGVIISLFISTGFFFGMFLFFQKKLKVPSQVQKIESKEERVKKFNYYISTALAFLHGPVVIAYGIWSTLKHGTSYDQPNRWEDNFLLIVRFFL